MTICLAQISNTYRRLECHGSYSAAYKKALHGMMHHNTTSDTQVFLKQPLYCTGKGGGCVQEGVDRKNVF
jgi:hypothetical protein